MLEVKHHRTYYGPNPYSAEPVMVLDLLASPDFGPEIVHLCESFRAHYADWFEQAESAAASAAVFAGETTSHWALCALNEVRGYLHAAGAMPSPQGSRIWLGFHDEAVSQAALQIAFKALMQAQRPDVLRAAVQTDLEKLWDVCKRQHPDFLAHILMQAARSYDIPVRQYVKGARLWQYGWGARSRVFTENTPNNNGGKYLTSYKVLSKAIFEGLGAPTPAHRLVSRVEELEQAAVSVGWPCVVKPVQGSRGTGVTANIRTLAELQSAFNAAGGRSRNPVMVEAFVSGEDHRLMVVQGRFLRAIRREPAYVIGDGVHTISELVERVNRTRTVNFVKSRYLRPIRIDDVLLKQLAEQGVSLDSTLPDGVRVNLRSIANISTGGVATDVTAALHPDTARLAELITQSMGLVTAGLDFISADIGKSFVEVGAFIEINAMAGVAMLVTAGNDPVFVGKEILGDEPGRIPLTLVVLSDDDLPEAGRWLQSRQWPAHSAWACGRLANVSGAPLKISQTSPWAAVDAVLKHPVVRSASIYCSEAEILRWGLPVDRADRLVLCNVELPDEWNAVLSASATQIERSRGWREAATVQVSAPGDRTRLTAVESASH